MSTDAIAARQHLVDDRHYKYRGCAPDEDDRNVSVGDPDVPVDAWAPYTDDGAEPQRVRLARERTALAICGRCPVLALCRTYANTTVVEDGVEHLVEPEGILGGELALTRHRALIARRHAATVGATAGDTAVVDGTVSAAPVVRDLVDARTQQKRAVLVALARETDPERVACLAGMDLRTTNWHRSALVGMLGLDRERATRDQLLAAAVEAGLLARSTRIRPDGLWPYAAAPTTDGARQRRIAPGRPVQLMLPGLEDLPRTRRTLTPAPGRHTTGPRTAATSPAGPGRAPRRRTRLRIVPAPRPTPLPLTVTTVLEPAS